MIIIQICLRIISPLWIQITLERINSKVERLQLSLDQSISQCGYVYRLTCTLSLLHILFDKRQHQNKLNKTEVERNFWRIRNMGRNHRGEAIIKEGHSYCQSFALNWEESEEVMHLLFSPSVLLSSVNTNPWLNPNRN